MATYTIRGRSHNIVYTYKTIDGKRKQQWESYSSELEAIQRKAYIDYLQAQNNIKVNTAKVRSFMTPRQLNTRSRSAYTVREAAPRSARGSVPTRDNAAESLGQEGVRCAANQNQNKKERKIKNEIICLQKLR